MNKVNFNFCNKSKIIEISGSEYDENTIESFLNLITQITKENKNINLKIIGNFDSKLLVQSLISNKNNQEIDKILVMFQLISKTIQNSKINFTAEINGIVQGPAMEIALCCNYIQADHNTILKLEETSQGIIPFLGTIQRLTKLIGYKNSLQAFLVDKEISYEKGLKFKLFNNKIDNLIKVEKKSFFGIRYLLIHLYFIILKFIVFIKIKTLLIMQYCLLYLKVLFVIMKWVYLLKKDG